MQHHRQFVMSTSIEQLVCAVCRVEFGLEDRLPVTQACQHSTCKQCVEEKDLHNCPLDGFPIDRLAQVNRPLVYFLYGDAYREGAADSLGQLALWLRANIDRVSPQQARKLLHLISSTHYCSISRPEFLRRTAAVFNRLLLELIQAHYNTKQREQDVIKLIEQVGCTILNPKLTETVIQLLVKLYKAANQCNDTSFERSVLIKFLLKELGERGAKKRQVERIVQTLYRCSCFEVTAFDGAPSRLRLRSELCNEFVLRQQHDTEIIKIATCNQIRLPPESWAYLLTQRSSVDNTSRMQSILDKCQQAPTVDELRTAISRVGDKYNLGEYLDDLDFVQDLLLEKNPENDLIVMQCKISDILKQMTNLRHLFSIRQCRAKLHEV